jgi:hypothetical protein
MQVPTFHYPTPRWSAGFTGAAVEHARAIAVTARDVWERATVDPSPDRLSIGTVTDVALSIADRVARADTIAARADHSRWHGNVTTGDPSPAAPAPDPFERVRADTVRETSNRGVTVDRVTVHGRAMVGGDTVAAPSPALTMSPDRLAYAIDTAPRTALGHVDAIALARLTAVAYPDVPDMLGGDVLTWHERPTFDDTLARQARRGWPTRYRLPTVRPRADERADMVPRDTAVDWLGGDVPDWSPATVARLLAPSADPSHAWRGHVLHERPATVHATRSAPRRVDERVTVPDGAALGDALAAVVAHVPRGAAYTAVWSHRGTVGTVTVSGDRPRFSVTGLPSPVRGYRTARGMARAVDRLTA